MSVALLALLVAACGGDDGGGDAADPGGAEETAAGGDAGSGGASRKPELTVDPATAGSISGTVSATGTPPAPKKLSMNSEPYCVSSHADGVFDDRIHVEGGRLLNAFVWIKSGLEDYRFDDPEGDVLLDQVGCLYTPRVVGAQLGQRVLVANSDDVMHNVHSHPENSRPQNFAQIAGSPERELKFRKPEVMVKVACDVHAWMSAWIGVVEHPYFDVTAGDGSYRLDGVPPGDYVLGVWHEKLGEQEVRVTLEANGEAQAGDVAFSL